MILGFKEKFADGTPTNFVNKILKGEKIHSIRKGERWKAGTLIQMATGVRTKNYKQFNNLFVDNVEKGLGYCWSVQDISIFFNQPHFNNFVFPDSFEGQKLTYRLIIDIKIINKETELFQLAKNDGFVWQGDFIEWFYNARDKETDTFKGQIIHWTEKRY